MIVGFIAMNLFIAVVLASMQQVDDVSLFDVLDDYIKKDFTQLWLKFDPSISGFISLPDLVRLEKDHRNPFKHFDPDGLDNGKLSTFAWSLSRGDKLCSCLRAYRYVWCGPCP